MTFPLSKYILFFLLLLEIASLSHGIKLRGRKGKKTNKKPKRCINDLCPLIKCAPDHISVIPDGQCCPVCKPSLDCSTVMCAACVEGEIPFFADGECCPKCEPEKLPDCRLVRCAQPLCSEGYEPIKVGCCETCQLKPNCVVVQCITEPCPPVCTTPEVDPLTEDVPCPQVECKPGYEPRTLEGGSCPTCVLSEKEVLEPCMMVSCMDPCYKFTENSEFVPVCAPEEECVTEMRYISGNGDHCPPTGCAEFVGCK
jgi:hypothetical protein